MDAGPSQTVAAADLLMSHLHEHRSVLNDDVRRAILVVLEWVRDNAQRQAADGGGRADAANALVNPVLATRFTQVFKDNLWGDDESISGPGSKKGSEIVTLSIAALNHVIATFGVRSMSDIPCGDGNWIVTLLDTLSIDYVGFDIVAPLIRRNTFLYPRYTFRQLDITSEVPPRSDLIFSKELFLHLTYADIAKAIGNMKTSGSTFLLASSHFGATNSELQHNLGGSFRELDVQQAPINFPEPLWRNALFGLWRLTDIPEPTI